jgi:hypothetical protein
MLPGIAKIIIEADINSIRFEHFCADLCSEIFGVTLLQTSRNYDLGVDARSAVTTNRSGKQVYDTVLHASLQQTLDTKVEKDIVRMAQASDARAIIYCSSQPLTELQVNRLITQIRELHRSVKSVSVLGSVQLSPFAEDKCREIFEKNYIGEISTLEARLLPTPQTTEKAEHRGLRLALIAFGSEDSEALRLSLLKSSILEALRVRKMQEGEILAVIGKGLGLAGRLRPQLLAEPLVALLEEKLITATKGAYSLTESGLESIRKSTVSAAKDLFEGRNIIRTSLEELTGVKIDEKGFTPIWEILLDFLSELFYTKGFQVICAINSVFDREKTHAAIDKGSLDAMIERGAERIAALYKDARSAERMKQAIIDTFAEHSGKAFEWLAAICERFVALCALGLETSSAEELKLILARYRIVLDSNILLDILCEGEPGHKAALEVFHAWRRIGGTIYVAVPVLDEVAHHAWISDVDFGQTEHLFGKLYGQEKLRYIKNAFVRAYHTLERNPLRWKMYIGQYRGKYPEDHGNILRILRNKFGVEMLTTACQPETKAKMAEFFVELFAASNKGNSHALSRTEIGKAERDGELFACIAEARTNLGKSGSDDVVVLVSSSAKMVRADGKFRNILGQPDAVLSMGAVSYLISLVPELAVGLATLRQVLFEFGERVILSDEQRIALRIIKASGEYDVPWAERTMLQQHLGDSVTKEAKRRGVSPDEVTRRITVPNEGDDTPARMILESVRALAVESATEERLVAANKQIKSLEERLEGLRDEVRKMPRSN